MKNKQVIISDDEELKLIEAHREKKEIAEKEKSENEKLNYIIETKFLTLNDKFAKVVKEANCEIIVHLNNAKREIKLAEKISEAKGVPFFSSVSDFKVRQYIPKSFEKLWNKEVDIEAIDIGFDLLEYNNFYGIYNCEEDCGWEYWNSSSISC